ncbi:c-type cytochrome [Luteolibacter luteus]|uniref:Cytochrome c n=1 Tax=Luteolibacter luteus TaxID=2728835 RepID=A0A858RF45_9BACT|nr:cytochrome c [Luteolibacter luteus]QJE95345.1 cytochrome c [Luteolibacter luteus]
MRKTLLFYCLGLSPLLANPLLTYENRPLGSSEEPLVMSTYLPDPGLDPAVFSHHYKSAPAPKYNPGKGEDVPGEEKPIPGVAAGLAVSFGPSLAYVFDTTESRLFYAWQGGFLDFTPYWGDQKRGSRVSFDYVPKLVGNLFHKTSGKNPVQINGKSVDEFPGGPQYVGYSLIKGAPRFEYKAGDHLVTVLLKPSAKEQSFEAEVSCTPPAPLAWKEGDFSVEGKDGKLAFTYTGKTLGSYQGYQVKIDLRKANKEAGETLYNNYGCIACHSTDGSKGHGPSLGGLADTMVELEGSDQKVLADREYLLESIKNPNAKIAKGYPPNYMPPFGIPDVEYDSLVLFIQSLSKPE